MYDHYGVIGGGSDNIAGADDGYPAEQAYATVSGGFRNHAQGLNSTVGGGYWNYATGDNATVPGGYRNEANGDYSFAAGRRAKAEHEGSFVWADGQDADFASTIPYQFLIRAAGGVGIGTNAPGSPLHVEDQLADNDRAAILGDHSITDYRGIGVRGVGGFRGVEGEVEATGSESYTGVRGSATGGTGINHGLYGYATTDGTGTNFGVYGYAAGGNDNYAGYFLTPSENAIGVYGESPDCGGFFKATGYSGYGVRVMATGDASIGIVTEGTHGILAFGSGTSGSVAVYGVNPYGGYAGRFDGQVQVNDANLEVNGTTITEVLEITGGSDLSEKFEVSSPNGDVSPGMVVCIDAANPGRLVTSTRPYDQTVAGIVSGAGGVKPGMLMGQKNTQLDGSHPVALTGRVWAWCDASYGSIQPGDLLTTSFTAGHAMKATDHTKAQGAIIGKAMSSLDEGKGLVLILVSLQ